MKNYGYGFIDRLDFRPHPRQGLGVPRAAHTEWRSVWKLKPLGRSMMPPATPVRLPLDATEPRLVTEVEQPAGLPDPSVVAVADAVAREGTTDVLSSLLE